MKIPYGVISGLIILALISMAGVCAAEETTTNAVNLTEGQQLPPPLPDYTMTSTNTSWGNRTRLHQGMAGDFTGYNTTIGADNPLYGLRIAFEDLDESFTFNETERLEKRLQHGNDRLADYLAELSGNRTGSADTAFGMYREKMNQTGECLDQFRHNDTGLMHAQEMVTKHQAVLAGLLAEHPDNQGLARAFNNSQQLELKFAEKTRVRFEQSGGAGNTTSFRPVMIGNGNGMGTMNGNGQDNQSRQQGQSENKNKNGQGQADNQSTGNNGNRNLTGGQDQTQSGQNGKGNNNQDQQSQTTNQQQSKQNGRGNNNQDERSPVQQPSQNGGQKR